MKPPVLIVNSYAGSLTQAAHDERHPIIASARLPKEKLHKGVLTCVTETLAI